MFYLVLDYRLFFFLIAHFAYINQIQTNILMTD